MKLSSATLTLSQGVHTDPHCLSGTFCTNPQVYFKVLSWNPIGKGILSSWGSPPSFTMWLPWQRYSVRELTTLSPSSAVHSHLKNTIFMLPHTLTTQKRGVPRVLTSFLVNLTANEAFPKTLLLNYDEQLFLSGWEAPINQSDHRQAQ